MPSSKSRPVNPAAKAIVTMAIALCGNPKCKHPQIEKNESAIWVREPLGNALVYHEKCAPCIPIKPPVELTGNGLHGLRINEIARRLCALAKKEGTKATFVFNDLPIEAGPTNTPEWVVELWALDDQAQRLSRHQEELEKAKSAPLDIAPGDRVERAARLLLNRAQEKDCQQNFDFNGVEVVAHPSDTPKGIVARWFIAYMLSKEEQEQAKAHTAAAEKVRLVGIFGSGVPQNKFPVTYGLNLIKVFHYSDRVCDKCGKPIEKNTEAWWDRKAQKFYHSTCL